MTMEIQDSEGNLITTIGPGKNKGINTVKWNYYMSAPKVAKGKTISRTASSTPRAPAGTYKAVITKGKDVYEHTFTIENDPKVGLTQDDYALKHSTTMKLFDMTQDLAYMVYKLDAYHDSLSDGNEKLSNQFNELKETLVVTTGDNYVGAAEPQLREKLADLYAKVANSYDVPTKAEMDNLTAIEARFEAAKKEFDKLEKKTKGAFSVMTFEEFIDS